MDLMRSWVDIEVEKVSIIMCNLCGEDCESVGHFLWSCPVYSERCALFLEHLKNNFGNEFELFKRCDIHVYIAGKLHFILGTELWGSHNEQLLRLVKSYIIDIWELRKSKLYVWLWHWYRSAAVSKPTR